MTWLRALIGLNRRLALIAAVAAVLAGIFLRAPQFWRSLAVLDAAAQEPQAAAKRNGVTCHTEFVAMRDGVLLATDVYLPSAPGPHPVILQRTPYGLRLGHGCFVGTSGTMAFWAENGYVGLTQDVRGTFRSQGTFHPIFQEQTDGYDAVEWAAAQPWSTGKVGMTGSSYFGVTQWQAAITTPPHLSAIAPAVTATDYHDNWTYANGVFDLWFAQSWLLEFFTPDEYRRQLMVKGTSSDDARKASDGYLEQNKQWIFTKWAPQIPLAKFQDFRTLAPYYYEWLAHPNYDDYWAKVDVERQFGAVTVPALVTGGWYDLFEIGSVRSYVGMRMKGGSEAARNGTKLVMQGGGAHGGPGVVTVSPANNIALQALQLRFYDHYLKGVDNGVDREPRVQLFVQVPPDSGKDAGGFWATGDSFPLPGTEQVRFNLRSAGRANTLRGDGLLDMSRPSEGSDDKYVYDPGKPVPSLGGGLCCLTLGSYFGSGAQDQTTVEQRDDVLVYTSAPLAKDLPVVGQAKVKFWAKSSARDTDFTAKLVDVHPDGFAQNMLDRIVRASMRGGSKSQPSGIEPGTAYEYEIDLGYTGTVFKTGHRIRLDISSSNFPHFARNLNTGNDSSTDDRVQTARQTLLHDRSHPAYLELSVVPDLKAP
jgi:putative CocE/NonD family hydrolase